MKADLPALDHRALLSAASGGDQGAWDVLVAQYNSLLWSIARGYRLDTADAADAVQTTWLRLVEHIDRIADPDRLVGWLATTVRRECLSHLRRSGRERPGAEEHLVNAADAAEPLDAALLADERDAALWRAVDAMSERCRRLLRVLMASPPPSYTAVSAALDMPIGSIGPARQRCLAQLRRAAADDELLSPGERR
jgi:RNA polymerase sigma factor (sigma-70 family)